MPNRMDQLIVSRGTAAVTPIEARLDGLKGVFRTLAQQHADICELLHRVKSGVAMRRELWPRVRVELLAHERAEMREVYPVLRQRSATRTFADHHDDEAKDLETLIGQLDAIDVDTDAWGVLFAQLSDIVVAHTKEEERAIFPAAQQALGDALADELKPRFLAARQQIADAV